MLWHTLGGVLSGPGAIHPLALPAFEEVLQCVQERAFAEAARTRQEIVLAPLDWPARVGGLVHGVAVGTSRISRNV